jgi:hypothetical protein
MPWRSPSLGELQQVGNLSHFHLPEPRIFVKERGKGGAKEKGTGATLSLLYHAIVS